MFEKLFLPHVCLKKLDLPDVWKKWFLLTRKKIYQAWKSNPPLPSVIKWLVPMKVVIYHELHIQSFQENCLIILQEML
jgi:hypothetical protein